MTRFASRARCAYFVLILISALPTVSAETFRVTNTNGAGVGSLRSAIGSASTTPNVPADVPDRIEFDIPGPGPHVIRAAQFFDIAGDALFIDGYSQPGALANTLAVGTDAIIQIQLDCTDIGGTDDCIVVGAAGTRIAGLSVTSAPGSGLHVAAPGVRIEGNFVGVDPRGNPSGNLRAGIRIASASAARIGGSEPSARNLVSENGGDGIVASGDEVQIVNNSISANLGDGVSLLGNAQRPVVSGNVIGLAPDGRSADGNTGAGVRVADVTDATVSNNVISANLDGGIVLQNFANRSLVLGNLVGTDVSGTVGRGNHGRSGIHIADGSSEFTHVDGNTVCDSENSGISVDEAGQATLITANRIGLGVDGSDLGNGLAGIRITDAADVSIGGTQPGELGNHIAFNAAAGISLADSSESVAILGNQIHDNGGLGIDLGNDGPTGNDADADVDTGDNGLQNFPVIATAVRRADGTTRITGTLASSASAEFRVELFASIAADPAGSGEGETPLGAVNVTTDVNGQALFTFESAVDRGSATLFSATATALASSETSEFSQAAGSEAVGGTVFGVVFDDLNGDGLFDPFLEPGIQGVAVFDDVNGNGVNDPGELGASSGPEGAYSMSSPTDDTVDLRQVLPTGREETTAPDGPVVLSGGVVVGAVDFGSRIPLTGGVVSGIVFDDQNGNGLLDAGLDSGVAGVLVFDDANGDGVHNAPAELSATSAVGGGYTLSSTADVVVDLRQIVPLGREQTSNNPVALLLTAGAVTEGVHFGSRGAPGGPIEPAPPAASAPRTVPALDSPFLGLLLLLTLVATLRHRRP